MLDNITIIGLGRKSRQGKDLCATLIANSYDNVHICHWADALYKEVHNERREHPLLCLDNGQIAALVSEQDYFLVPENSGSYESIYNMLKSNNNIYWGMDDKNSILLQFWGTDLRRAYFDTNYWVHQTMGYIISQSKELSTIENHLFLIPDTRFKNESASIKHLGGKYIDVQRYDEDGSRFIAPDRDPTHPSECDLDDIEPDYIISATSRDIESIQTQCSKIINEIEIIRASVEAVYDEEDEYETVQA